MQGGENIAASEGGSESPQVLDLRGLRTAAGGTSEVLLRKSVRGCYSVGSTAQFSLYPCLWKVCPHGLRETAHCARQPYPRLPVPGSVESAPQSCETPDSRTAVEPVASWAAEPSHDQAGNGEGRRFEDQGFQGKSGWRE